MKTLVNVLFNVREDGGWNGGKEYVFAAHEELWPGDVVVVDTRNGFALATVAGIAEKLPRSVPVGNLKEVVCKVDFTAYDQRKEVAAKRKELKAEMDKKVKELQNNAIYEMMAEKDPALKAMLDEYQQLQGD